MPLRNYVHKRVGYAFQYNSNPANQIDRDMGGGVALPFPFNTHVVFFREKSYSLQSSIAYL